MNKRPSLQFYPADWRKDPQLQMCNMATQGIWINILCCMWEANEEGKLEGNWQDFSRLLGITEQEIKRFYLHAKAYKFADVTNCNGNVTIINRRMNNAFLERERVKKGMRAHRAKQSYEKVTPHSSTSTSSSTTNNKYMSIFDLARKYYPGEKRGLDTEFSYFCKLHKDWREVLPLLLPAMYQEEARHMSLEGASKFVPSWKHFKTWIYNRCWEVTTGKTVTPKEDAAREQQALEKKRQQTREEYGDYYQEQTIEELQSMRKNKTLITHWWLIYEIIQKRSKQNMKGGE